MKRLSLLLLTALISGYVFAYPITPRPLRKLVIESEYIITGTVLELGTTPDNKKEDSPRYNDYALILVEEILQGKRVADTIRVYYSGRMICPAPAHFILHSKVVAFLDKLKKSNGYTVHALSYGVKNLDEEGISVYKHRITEMQRILKMPEGYQQEERILDWLVTCAGNTYTRWEGVYELSPGSDFMSYYDRDDLCPKNIFLSSTQRKRLFDALIRIDTLNNDDLMLADLTVGIDDIKILEFLKKNLLLVDKDYWWVASSIMEKIVDLTGSNELDALLEKFLSLSDFDKKEKKQKRNTQDLFINKMQGVPLKKTVAATGINPV
jgi:hypothetical protein